MNTYLCTNIPIQMISCTDTNGKITPLRFRFLDKDGSLVTINVDRVIQSNQEKSRVGASFECSATVFGSEKRFYLYYSAYSGTWIISKIR